MALGSHTIFTASTITNKSCSVYRLDLMKHKLHQRKMDSEA